MRARPILPRGAISDEIRVLIRSSLERDTSALNVPSQPTVVVRWRSIRVCV